MSKKLDDYQSKRDFGQTTEPKGSVSGEDEGLFVIQRHEARQLHYDLRLEVDGVLQSWALPKIYNYDPKVKRLAVRTEDHPLEYLKFEGVIPLGQYGAGTMKIWDRGTYRVENGNTNSNLPNDKIELVFRGTRLWGKWHLVRLKDTAKDWLLFKAKDRYSRPKDEPTLSLNLLDTRETAFPRHTKMMSATVRRKMFLDPSWIYEPELPGVRVRVEKRGDDLRLRDSQGTDYLNHFENELSDIRHDLEKLRAESVVLEGMLIAAGDDGIPVNDLDSHLENAESPAPLLYLFDMLYFESWSTREFPLIERKAGLQSLLPATRSTHVIEHARSDISDLLDSCRQLKIPRLIAKHSESRYYGSKSSDWCTLPVGKSKGKPKGESGEAGPESTQIEVRITNPGRVLWPQAGLTKKQLVEYYEAIADTLIPHLQDRPLSLHRFPDGIDSESFFQKNMRASAPKWLDTEWVASSGRRARIRYLICGDANTLKYLGNQGSIELHPWFSRRGRLDSPDWVVWDLDPLGDAFKHTIVLAREIGRLLRGAGLRPLIKTSGAKGLHIYLPVDEDYSYNQTRQFSEAVAQLAFERHPKISTLDRSKVNRRDRVYIDTQQNRRGQTIVAPYVPRPVAEASVSTPLVWDEISERGFDPANYGFAEVLHRVEQMGDLFQAVLYDRQDLLPAIDALAGIK